jgi:hypothetical protein
VRARGRCSGGQGRLRRVARWKVAALERELRSGALGTHTDVDAADAPLPLAGGGGGVGAPRARHFADAFARAAPLLFDGIELGLEGVRRAQVRARRSTQRAAGRGCRGGLTRARGAHRYRCPSPTRRTPTTEPRSTRGPGRRVQRGRARARARARRARQRSARTARGWRAAPWGAARCSHATRWRGPTGLTPRPPY